MESIKAFNTTDSDSTKLQITGTEIGNKRVLDVFPRNNDSNPLYTNSTSNHNTSSVSTLDLYQVQDYDESYPEVLYVGMTRLNGEYLIKQIKITNGEIRYANPSSTGEPRYDLAWNDRLIHTYQYLYELTGV